MAAFPKRRWLRFSLRTMLVTVTVLCVWLAIVCQNAARQHRAFEVIKASGGMIGYQHGPNDFPVIVDPNLSVESAWLCKLMGTDPLATAVVFVELRDGQISAETISALKAFPHLRHLRLSGKTLSDGAMDEIGRLHLRHLVIGNCNVTSIGWKSLSKLTDLLDISLQGLDVSDATLADIRALPNVSLVELADTRITSVGVASLKEMRSLRQLRLYRNMQLSADGIAKTQREMPGVQFTVTAANNVR